MNETSSGKNGYDLHLTIDVELQKKVDDILEDTLKKYAGTAGREKFKKAIVVLMNPQTGEIYAMSGKYLDEDGKIQNYSSGCLCVRFRCKGRYGVYDAGSGNSDTLQYRAG